MYVGVLLVSSQTPVPLVSHWAGSSQDTSGSFHLMETVIDKASLSASNTVKSDNGGLTQNFVNVVQSVLAKF